MSIWYALVRVKTRESAVPIDLVVFCHLRWEFVYQRPQHLMSRFAKDRRVVFIEEPVHDATSDPHWVERHYEPNVTACCLHTPVEKPGFCFEQMQWLEPAIKELIDELGLEQYAAWFYTPMAMPLMGSISPSVVIYDCMDELSKFLHAPPELLELEQELLDVADLVFTGGPSLYRVKKDRHPAVYCFPSSVDAKHFAQGRDGNRAKEPADQASIPKPRLGYYGVIDERIDLPLLAELADSHPDWQIIMIGPVVKINSASLPQRENLHYLGSKDYKDLPKYVTGWDVCLMPFARNDSTQFISPTKTLEYMAAEKPIVSTPITDVAQPYGHIVYLGGNGAMFIDGCGRALAESEIQKHLAISKMRTVLRGTSWDATAAKMAELIDSKAGVRVSNSPEQVGVPVAVIGAGPTGLSAAYHLGSDAILIERNDTVGGWCRSTEQNGFVFDYAGHIMFSNDPYVHRMYDVLLGDNVHWQSREAWIYSHDVYTRYPFQGALFGLPPEVIKECIIGAIEARFGKLNEKKEESTAASKLNGKSSTATDTINGHAKTVSNGLTRLNARAANEVIINGNGHAANGKRHAICEGDVKDCCGDGIMESTARLGLLKTKDIPAGPPENFEDFIYQVWGSGIAKHFAIPYNQKLWAVPLHEMETSWLGGRVPLPDLEQMIDGALQPVKKPMGPNAEFGYPLRGGFQALMNGFVPHLKGELCLNTAVKGFSPRKHELVLSDGRRVQYECLVSTMPLPVLVRMASDEAPREVRDAASGLRYISVRCVNLGIGRENLTDKHWIYYPGDTIFHRIFVQGNASPHCNPRGGFGLTCEITYHNGYKPLPCDGQDLIDRCIADCRRVGIFNEDDPVWTASQCDMPHAYVVYDHQRKKNVALIREWLASHDVILAGRYSEWEYYNSDHAFLAGKRAAEEARAVISSQPAVVA
jgi:UDP-galactopyranose mutase